LRLTVVVDDLASGRGMLAEHGLSVLLEAGGERLLFDTGQGMALPENLKRLGVDPASIGTCVLSHGHYDHTGGLERLLRSSPGCRVVAHPEVFRPMWSLAGGRHPVGCPPGRPGEAELVLSREPLQVLPGVGTTGYVPRRTEYETVPEHFVDGNGRHDDIPDDMGLVIDAPAGTVLVTGCAHSGVVNTALQAGELAGSPPVVILGGFHLHSAGAGRVKKVAEALAGLGVERIYPGHCTGERQTCELAARFGACRRIHTGFTLDLTGDINGMQG
jgi:7,8-dihydropterin-6-yl-methyl-4-(beta-D-ribofuranosyl)aminobenzene 5'-phosphate synthase